MIIENILSISNQKLNQIDTSFINNYELYHNTYYFNGESGKEHYRLLMYISSLYLNQILFDIGTNKCMSALALSYNQFNKIKTFDIVSILPENPKRSNIEYNLGDSTKDSDIKNTPFIFLDVNHDGIYENIIYDFLKSINWNGILMLDDIHLNNEMKNFWNSIEYKKYDITNIGHWSGTGIVDFGKH
jgi:hypothetical protein